jgi:hypothetical protein
MNRYTEPGPRAMVERQLAFEKSRYAGAPFPLNLTLSPKEREPLARASGSSEYPITNTANLFAHERRRILPLPQGEGSGVRGNRTYDQMTTSLRNPTTPCD